MQPGTATLTATYPSPCPALPGTRLLTRANAIALTPVGVADTAGGGARAAPGLILRANRHEGRGRAAARRWLPLGRPRAGSATRTVFPGAGGHADGDLAGVAVRVVQRRAQSAVRPRVLDRKKGQRLRGVEAVRRAVPRPGRVVIAKVNGDGRADRLVDAGAGAPSTWPWANRHLTGHPSSARRHGHLAAAARGGSLIQAPAGGGRSSFPRPRYLGARVGGEGHAALQGMASSGRGVSTLTPDPSPPRTGTRREQSGTPPPGRGTSPRHRFRR